MDWHRLIWFFPNVPKFAMVSQMALLNRLPTLDSIDAWALTLATSPVCFLCIQADENRDHRFWPAASLPRSGRSFYWHALLIECLVMGLLFEPSLDCAWSKEGELRLQRCTC